MCTGPIESLQTLKESLALVEVPRPTLVYMYRYVILKSGYETNLTISGVDLFPD